MNSTTTVVLERDVTYSRLEDAWRRAKEARASDSLAYAELGMRAAKARDPRLMKALERGAEVMDAARENQVGQYQRMTSTSFADKAVPTEVQMWRRAYEFADRGEPLIQLQWVYGMAADLAGLRI